MCNSALKRMRQKYQKFKTSLGYIVRLCSSPPYLPPHKKKMGNSNNYQKKKGNKERVEHMVVTSFVQQFLEG